jgi:acetylglutamate kinase
VQLRTIKNGQLLNTNADTIASELAIAFIRSFEVTLSYCFLKTRCFYDAEDDSSVIAKMNLNCQTKG